MPPSRSSLRVLERWLWTGPAGHLAGGALDFAAALSHYAAVRLASSRAGRRGAAETHPAGAGPQQTGSRASRQTGARAQQTDSRASRQTGARAQQTDSRASRQTGARAQQTDSRASR